MMRAIVWMALLGWIVLFAVALRIGNRDATIYLLIGACIFLDCLFACFPGYNAYRRNHPQTTAICVGGFLWFFSPLIFFVSDLWTPISAVAWCVLVVWSYAGGKPHGKAASVRPVNPLGNVRPANLSYPSSPLIGIQGKYEVFGVDRQSKLDTSWVVTASSEANARVKAELEGIIVTAVNRVE